MSNRVFRPVDESLESHVLGIQYLTNEITTGAVCASKLLAYGVNKAVSADCLSYNTVGK